MTMKYRIAAMVLVALAMVVVFASKAAGETEPGVLISDSAAFVDQGKTITITIDRAYRPAVIFHPGLMWQEEATVTVRDFVIRDYMGKPIDGFVVQTASGRTEIPIQKVKEIRFSGCVHRVTKDIPYIQNVTSAKMVLADGTTKDVLMNADFGTIEGKTEKGDFFLGDPYTVKHLVFER